ncbi:multidrug efflux SMR transporter [Pectobacterium versatile]|uniref:DMT family transporter n=1 Tax=Pectobacterium versatile TaxID=2488639 RepID=UPI002B241F25|nr:multidrug efflux SMR transporter [Pectobacterium versatile]
MSSMLSYAALALAIVLEVAATMFLGKSEHFTRLVPTLICGALYACSFYMLAQALRTLPLGIAYASWGGLGIILTAVIGVVVFKQKPDAAAIAGIALIVVGVVVINIFSKMSAH